jgi:hypothetical protein
MEDDHLRFDLKNLLGRVPFVAEMYWYFRQKGFPPPGSFSLKNLRNWLANKDAYLTEELEIEPAVDQKDVLLFSFAPYWISQTTVTGLALAGLGHQVSLGFLPFTRWQKREKDFDLRRQNLYIKETLKPVSALLNVFSFWEEKTACDLPSDLRDQLNGSAARDVKYTLMREEVDPESDLYHLRQERNQEFAQTAYAWLQQHEPDVVIIPNGSVLEYGILYTVARYLDITTVTYEFGEQRERVWLAQNRQVIRMETDPMWEACQDQPLSEAEWKKIRTLFSARQGGDLWKTFKRRWQDSSRAGGQQVRESLGLDERPIVFLPTNVQGDSLTLDREIFSQGMTDWIVRTIQYFINHSEYQLVVRVHPGEKLSWGASMMEVIDDYFEALPEHVHVIPAEEDVNSYDLAEIATLAVVYTTTLGLEMAMIGKPVIVVGETHYRAKGFTVDPESWEAYFTNLDDLLKDPSEGDLSEEQVKRAWTYAYRFFFEYPFPFPWHVQHVWDDLEKWPLARVIGAEGRQVFGQTFQYFLGQAVQWHKS